MTPELSKFINEIGVRTLQVITNGESFKCFPDQVMDPPNGTREVHFVKLDNNELEAETIRD